MLGKGSGTPGPGICSGAGSGGSREYVDASNPQFLLASPHPHARANATVWEFQAGRLGACRSHTCCHSCQLLASSKFQTCRWWARAEVATAASPGRTTSVPETQWLCQEANPTVWVGAGVSSYLGSSCAGCCGKS